MFRSFIEKITFLFYSLFLIFLILGLGSYFVLSRNLPQLPAQLEKINLSLPTEIYSTDGEILMVLGARHPVPIQEISKNFLNAIIAVEDARFFKHSGLDHMALVRAMVTNIKHKKIVQGGSTITQQLAKNLFFTFQRDWIRKVRELLIAFQMEATFSKQKILEAYCNQIYFGNGAYGVEDASRVYFGKPAKDLELRQAALLAGLPNSPNNANPFSNFERARKRTDYVLKRMKTVGIISSSQYQEALRADLKLIPPKQFTDPNLYFVDYVISLLENDYGKELVHFGGLKIVTTLDTRMQKVAHKAGQTHLEFLEKRMTGPETGDPLQTALVSVENKNGAVRAMLGGRDYSQSQYNRAVSNNRLAGSAFKPFVYFTAMESLGYSPATVVRDEPITIEIPGTSPWRPQNFGKNFYGDLVLKKALMKSINVVSAKLVQELGPEKVIATARKFGIKSPIGKHYSIALGTAGVSLVELASAYSVIANLGVYNEPYFIQWIEDYNGNRLYEHFYHGVQRFPKKSVYPLLDMMRGVVDGGTGYVVRRMGFKHPAAGKTGTTNDYKDARFTGFTKDYSVGVWVGYDNNEPMIDINGKGLTGAGGAAPIWVFFMKKAMQGKNKVNFPIPEGIRRQKVNIQTGYQVDESAENSIWVAVKEGVDLEAPDNLQGPMLPPVGELEDPGVAEIQPLPQPDEAEPAQPENIEVENSDPSALTDLVRQLVELENQGAPSLPNENDDPNQSSDSENGDSPSLPGTF